MASFAGIGRFFSTFGHVAAVVGGDALKVVNVATANSAALSLIPGVGPEIGAALNMITGVESLFPTAGLGAAKKALVVAGMTATAAPGTAVDTPTLSQGIDAAVKALGELMDAVVMIEAAVKGPAPAVKP